MFLSGCKGSGASNSESDFETGFDQSTKPENFLASDQEEESQSPASAGQVSGRQQIETVNQQIALAAFNPSPSFSQDRKRYRVGPGDVLDISVFQVEDLNRSTRVSGDGYIALPLVGQVDVSRLTTSEIENILAEKLGEEYLHDPQVTVFISEFRSHQVAVLGSVTRPDVYNIDRPKTIVEMLSLAGGLSNNAGNQLHIQRTVKAASGERKRETAIIAIKDLLTGSDANFDFPLQNGDSILIPKAGTVFVEGAVERPGGYPVSGETNVLKLLAMAQGVRGYARKGHIQVYRQNSEIGDQLYEVNLNEIRDDQTKDIALQDGDLVIVRANPVKKGIAGFWREFTRLFSFGTL